MSVEVFLTPSIQYVINDVKSIKVDGKTIGDCLDNLIKQYPQLKDLIFDNKLGLRDNLNIFINGAIASPQDLTKSVRDGDKIHIVDVIIGG